MFVDARSLPDNDRIEADVCIVGAGAAGITMARELSGRNLRVALLESGGFELDEETQALYGGRSIGRNFLEPDVIRLRYFGGTTNHWGGRCVPLAAVDFEERPWIPYSGWPIRREDLDSYYRRAMKVIRLGSHTYDLSEFRHRTDLPLLPLDEKRVKSIIPAHNALRFGKSYRGEIRAAPNVTAYLHANVVSIDTDHWGREVRQLQVATLTGKRHTVAASQYVLATGSVENARLLLLSNAVHRNGIGNEHDLVGRFLMDHIWYPNGLIFVSDSSFRHALYTARQWINDVDVKAAITFTDDVIREQGLASFHAEIRVAERVGGRWSASYLWRQLLSLEIPDDLDMHVGNIVADMGLGGEKPLVLGLNNHIEQIPNPDSRVYLSEERDHFNLNRVILDWRLSPFDHESMLRAHKLLAAEVGRSGFGRMKIQLPEHPPEPLPHAMGGDHQLGTTRMHEDPKRGVVDADCRVHGVSNLFIAGGSVFPTVGYANPTLTVVALAIRLADHIRGIMT